MKKGFSILFLLLFSLRPGYYVGQYVYYEWNIDTIIQKYCVNKDKPQMQCNGKCHLAKQLQLTENSDKNQAVRVFFEAFFPVFIQELPNVKFQTVSVYSPRKESFFYKDCYQLQLEYALYRPPIS